jgi:glycosyltransferase involved in cell wall biosynthesis
VPWSGAAADAGQAKGGLALVRVLIVGAASSSHIQNWVEVLSGRGHELWLATQHRAVDWAAPPGVEILELSRNSGAGYFLNSRELKRHIRSVCPDVVNAHYASGYGTTAALAKAAPLVVSVWGSDVYEFPEVSRLNRALLRWNLRRADRVASTSKVMRLRTLEVAPRLAHVDVTPFGVDMDLFHAKAQEKRASDEPITVGTVKTLAPTYGIDLLLRAFAYVAGANPSLLLKLVVAGEGEELSALEALAADLGVADRTSFLGRIPREQVPQVIRQIDVFVVPSRRESFGVAAVEAGACGVATVVSDAGGLPEVVVDGVTGLVVEKENVALLAAAIERLVLDPALRASLGSSAAAHVRRLYSWERCAELMEQTYAATIAG